jgi:PTH1 family peptidyl-tRNA hydrolase
VHLVVGLGNPGAKYSGNRHNVGFMAVERLSERAGGAAFRDKFSGKFTRLSSPDAVLLEPMTFMNLSGESVQAAMQFFKVALKDVVVIHDELDLPFGELRIKQGGGAAGHNGLKSIIQHCGGEGFARIRVGIGRPRGEDVVGHVLSDFSTAERAGLPDVLDRAAEGAEAILSRGVQTAMNAFNTRLKK